MAAMLVVKNKRISLLWELDSIFVIFMEMLREKIPLFWSLKFPGRLARGCKPKKLIYTVVHLMWRHGGYVGCQEQKDFSPLGTRLYFRYFHVNASRKNSIVLTPKIPWPPCTWTQTQEIDLYCSTPYIILKFWYLLCTSVGRWSWLKKMTLYLLRLKSIVIIYSFKDSNLVCLVK